MKKCFSKTYDKTEYTILLMRLISFNILKKAILEPNDTIV